MSNTLIGATQLGTMADASHRATKRKACDVLEGGGVGTRSGARAAAKRVFELGADGRLRATDRNAEQARCRQLQVAAMAVHTAMAPALRAPGDGGVASRARLPTRSPTLLMPDGVRRVLACTLAEPTLTALATVRQVALEGRWLERGEGEGGAESLIVVKAAHTQGPQHTCSDAAARCLVAATNSLRFDGTWQQVQCPRGCRAPLHAHRVKHMHLNRYVQGASLRPHRDEEGPKRAPWQHCSALLFLLPHSSWEGGGELRVATQPTPPEKQIPANWNRASVGTEQYAAWDGVWLAGDLVPHGVTRVVRGVRYTLCVCLQCPSCETDA